MPKVIPWRLQLPVQDNQGFGCTKALRFIHQLVPLIPYSYLRLALLKWLFAVHPSHRVLTFPMHYGYHAGS